MWITKNVDHGYPEQKVLFDWIVELVVMKLRFHHVGLLGSRSIYTLDFVSYLDLSEWILGKLIHVLAGIWSEL